MSNIGNIFGNEGWIQSSIDRSRGKTRPGSRRRRAASRDAERRRETLLNDSLFKKYGNPADLYPKQKPRGLAAIRQQSILSSKKNNGKSRPTDGTY